MKWIFINLEKKAENFQASLHIQLFYARDINSSNFSSHGNQDETAIHSETVTQALCHIN